MLKSYPATGIRLSSALGLDAEDVDLEEGVLLLRSVKGGRVERVLLGKGISRKLARYLGKRTGPVFPGRDGCRISPRHAQRRFRMWRGRAGLSRTLSPHSLRHTFAQRLYDQTGDVLLVQSALGHKSITSTLVYARAGEQKLRKALGT